MNDRCIGMTRATSAVLIALAIWVGVAGVLAAQGARFPFVLHDEDVPHDDLPGRATGKSRYGGPFTPMGDLRALVVFAGFTNDGAPGPHNAWDYETALGSGDLSPIPDWSDQLLYDSAGDFAPANQDFLLSNYLFQMSLGQFRLVGTVFPKRINVTATTALNSSWDNYTRRVWQALDLDPQFQALDFSTLDRRENRPAFQFDNHVAPHDVPDGTLDYVVIIWRYNGKDPVGTSGLDDASGSGGGFAHIPPFSFSNGVALSEGFTITRGLQGGPEGIRGYFIHELAHTLDNSPHLYGANGVVGQYFYTGSAWSMTSNQVRSMNSANGWERWFLGWIDPQTATANGTFTLGDFIATGDALRIELPFPKDSGQYLWLENHQGISNFDSRDQFLENGVGDPLPASPSGILAYVEAISDNHAEFSVFGPGANGLGVINADGDYDWHFPAAPLSPNPQEWWGETIVYDFSRGRANPLSGQNETSAIRADFSGDGMIQHDTDPNTASNEQHDVIMEDGQFTYGPLGARLGWPAGFKVGIATNPTIVNRPRYDAANQVLGPRYLNGLSVKVAGYSGVEATVEVAFGDVEIDRDVRWAGNDIRLPDITGDPGPDAVVRAGVTVTLDRSETPDRHLPDPASGRFVNDTSLRCETDSLLRLDDGAHLVVTEGSELVVAAGGRLEIGDGARVSVRDQGSLVLEDGSTVVVRGAGQILIEGQDEPDLVAGTGFGRLVYGKVDSGQDPEIELVHSDSEIRVEGVLEIADNADFTFTGQGFLGFYVGPQPAGPNFALTRNLRAGTNSRITLRGQGPQDPVLRILHGTLTVPEELIRLHLERGAVELWPQARLEVLSALNFRDLRVTSDDGERNGHRGVALAGQPGVVIRGTTFEHGEVGLDAKLFLTGRRLDLLALKFLDNDVGLETAGGSVRIAASELSNNTIGWRGRSLESDSAVFNSSFINNLETGIEQRQLAVTLSVTGTEIVGGSAGVYGIDASGLGEMIVRCSRIIDHAIAGIGLDGGASLDLSSARRGGWNRITGNQLTIEARNAGRLYLEQGYNDLVSTSGRVLEGSIAGSCTDLTLTAPGNRWSPGGGAPGAAEISLVAADCPGPKNRVEVTDAQPLSAALSCGQSPVASTDNPWIFRLQATSISGLLGSTPSGTEGSGSTIRFGESTGLHLDLEYAVNDRLGIAIGAMLANRDADTALGAEGDLLLSETSGDFSLLLLGANYHLIPERRQDLYLGAFLGRVDFPDPPLFETDADLSLGFVLGAELPFGSDRYGVAGSARFIDSAVTLRERATGERSTISLGQWTIGLGLSYRF